MYTGTFIGIATQMVQMFALLQDEKTACITQLHHEISEMTSRMTIKEMEIVKLKEDIKLLTKHHKQTRAEDRIPPLLQDV